MQKEIVCINCPMGCRINVNIEDGAMTSATGAGCKKGTEYAAAECVNPVRTVTTTVKLKGAALKVLPVKTAKAAPKDKVMDCIRALRNIEVQAPVSIGDVIVENVCGTGINVLASRNAP